MRLSVLLKYCECVPKLIIKLNNVVNKNIFIIKQILILVNGIIF